MRTVNITLTEQHHAAMSEFVQATGTTPSRLFVLLLEQHLGQFAPSLLEDEYQRDAIASANSTMPDEVPF